MGLAISCSIVGVAWWALVGYHQRPTGCNLSFQHVDRRDRVIRRLPIIPTLVSECGPFRSRVAIGGSFMVLCDDCGKEYSYEPKEVLRLEMELPASLKPHPLFR